MFHLSCVLAWLYEEIGAYTPAPTCYHVNGMGVGGGPKNIGDAWA